MKFFGTLLKAAFIGRPNRFIVECAVGGSRVRAYLPNPGRLWELFFPGTLLYLTKHGEAYEGSTDYTVVAVEREGRPIMLHTRVNNLVARNLIERVVQEAHDSGSYIFIVRLKRDRKLAIGSLGEVRFRRGFYLYVGSAKEHLAKRVERHKRTVKNRHWHIDYLREASDYHAALPVRASDDLECELARALETVSEWSVPGFGSSDCACTGHLFAMTEDPVHSPAFIRLLLHFRIDRLEKYLRSFPAGT